MLVKILPYSKALMAVLGAVVAAVDTATASGSPTSQTAYMAVTAGITAVLVYLVPNTPKKGESDVSKKP